MKLNNLICVAPDVGGVERTRALSRRINSSIAIIDKRRPSTRKIGSNEYCWKCKK